MPSVAFGSVFLGPPVARREWRLSIWGFAALVSLFLVGLLITTMAGWRSITSVLGLGAFMSFVAGGFACAVVDRGSKRRACRNAFIGGIAGVCGWGLVFGIAVLACMLLPEQYMEAHRGAIVMLVGFGPIMGFSVGVAARLSGARLNPM